MRSVLCLDQLDHRDQKQCRVEHHIVQRLLRRDARQEWQEKLLDPQAG